MKYAAFLLMIIGVTNFSCHPTQPDMGVLVSRFADRECRAITLREYRFELANKIRFAEDTLMHTKDHSDSARLQKRLDSLRPEQDKIAEVSRKMADSIRIVFDSLTQNHLKTADEKSKFNKQLNDTLQKRGCVDQ